MRFVDGMVCDILAKLPTLHAAKSHENETFFL